MNKADLWVDRHTIGPSAVFLSGWKPDTPGPCTWVALHVTRRRCRRLDPTTRIPGAQAVLRFLGVKYYKQGGVKLYQGSDVRILSSVQTCALEEGDVLPSWWRCRKGGRIEVGVGTAPEIARAEGWVNYRISLVGEPHPLALEGQPALVLVAKDARGMTRHLAGHNQSLGFAVNTVACTTTAGAWGSRY